MTHPQATSTTIRIPLRARSSATRRPARVAPECDLLESRIAPAHIDLGLTAFRLSNRFAAIGGAHGDRLVQNDSGVRPTLRVASINSNELEDTEAEPEDEPRVAPGREPEGKAPQASVLKNGPLALDVKRLRGDLTDALSTSQVTDAQRLALRVNLKSLANSGIAIDLSALRGYADRLLGSLADGTFDSDSKGAIQFQTDFTNQFSSEGIDQNLVGRLYTDFLTVARNLNLSSGTLAKLADDRAAILSDLMRLGVDTSNLRLLRGSNLDLILSLGFGRNRRD